MVVNRDKSIHNMTDLRWLCSVVPGWILKDVFQSCLLEGTDAKYNSIHITPHCSWLFGWSFCWLASWGLLCHKSCPIVIMLSTQPFMGTEIQLIQFHQYSLLMAFVWVNLLVFWWVAVIRKRISYQVCRACKY